MYIYIYIHIDNELCTQSKRGMCASQMSLVTHTNASRGMPHDMSHEYVHTTMSI